MSSFFCIFLLVVSGTQCTSTTNGFKGSKSAHPGVEFIIFGVDPGFSDLKEKYYSAIFFSKNCMKMKIGPGDVQNVSM